ncbi:MAG: glycosyltransferase family 39 protein [Planctomycetaceae bacterium]|jgi:4-amino-4-deoxy-L-arabinose transferase-like glycosyltransferase|nr:glycosyltransferase family 39 protein [Planctomycetaceae bacterium]
MDNSSPVQQKDNHPLSVIRYPFLAAAAVYLCLFFQTPFEPYNALGADTPSRLSFFSYLLLPDVYFSSWFGAKGEFGLSDRLPVLFFTLLASLSALGFGKFFFRQFHFKEKLEPLEYRVFSFVFGLGFFSTLIFFLLLPGNFKWDGQIFVFTLSGAALFFYELLRNRKKDASGTAPRFHFPLLFIILCSLFLPLLFLAAMIPSTDYDVLSYHLAGAKEFAGQGSITFLPHNVYANMPFGAEMFYVWGMALTGSVFTGAMVGKTLIASTTVITALGLYCFGKRFFSETAGNAAMLLYITTPWVFYTSTVGLIDSVVGMYVFFAIYAVLISTNKSGIFLAGFFAGCAAACKYPAVIYAVFPLFVFIIVNNAGQVRRLNKTLFVFLLAVFLACAGWYIKNWYFTGNPVEPLCWNLFGDSTGTWNAAVNARWSAAHSPHGFGIGQFLSDMYRIFLASAWNAPLAVPFAAVAVAALKERAAAPRRAGGLRPLLVWLLFFSAVWWFCTHRLERFFVPSLPVLTVLAGIGAANVAERFGKKTLSLLLTVSTVYCFIVCGSPAPGKVNRFLAPLNSIRTDPNVSTPWAVYFNGHKPAGKILLIGEAKAFLYEVPVRYSVCWNETPLKKIVDSGSPQEEFKKQNIEYVLVDWGEINRFRSKGNYGFSEFVQQTVFDKLVADGVLEVFPPPDKETAETSTVVYRVSSRPFTKPDSMLKSQQSSHFLKKEPHNVQAAAHKEKSQSR